MLAWSRIVLQKLWYDRPVRTQLLIAIGIINLIAAIVAGVVSILNTRTATRVEIEASLEVAQRFVAATIKDFEEQGKLDQLEEQLPLELKHLRHVRILLMEPSGQLTILSPQPDAGQSPDANQAPKWFASLVHPTLVGRAVRVVSASGANPVVIVGEPADEIAEAWHYFSALALVWLVLEALILAVLYVVLGRVLDPLQSLSRGMLNLEDGDYTTRLRPPKVKELAVITNRFNMLAGALGTAREENDRLYQQLISVQEEERREIANELHDEAGPCLFGITANAASIEALTAKIPKTYAAKIAARVKEIAAIAERMKLTNRAMVKKLRPVTLGHVALAGLIDELAADFQRRHPDTHIQCKLGALSHSYGEGVDLTLYRTAQEGLANAIRHGHPKTVTLKLTERPAPDSDPPEQARFSLCLSIEDDGIGIAPNTPNGFGLTTMTERVRTLKGTCTIAPRKPRGTRLEVTIPVESEPVAYAHGLDGALLP